MQVDSFLSTATYVAGLTGLGSLSTVFIAIVRWSRNEREKGRAEQKKADDLAAYKKETTEKIMQVKETIERKVDDGIASLSGKIDAVKEDVAEVKKDIRNGGLKEAVAAMQASCGSKMATVETKLDDHIALSGHPGVREEISSLKATVKMLKPNEG